MYKKRAKDFTPTPLLTMRIGACVAPRLWRLRAVDQPHAFLPLLGFGQVWAPRGVLCCVCAEMAGLVRRTRSPSQVGCDTRC